jgi:pyrophosphatase PpaX
MSYRCVLFDLDGTLLDSADMIADSLAHAITTHTGSIPKREHLMEGIGTPLVDQLTLHAHALGHEDPAFVQAMVQTYLDDNLSRHDEEIRIFAGAKTALTHLKSAGHVLGIVTSKPVSIAKRGLNLFGLTEQFDVIVGCDSVTAHKPDPAPVIFALDVLEQTSDDTIFIGDSTHDIHSGNRAGVDTMAVLWGPYSRQTLQKSNPTYMVSTFEALIAVCQGAPTSND